jgi:hypothetical protein
VIRTLAPAIAGIPIEHRAPPEVEIITQVMEGWGGSRVTEPPLVVDHSVGSIDLTGLQLISPPPEGGYNFSYYMGRDGRVVVGYRGKLQLPSGPTRELTQAMYVREDGRHYELRYEAPPEAWLLQRLWLRTVFMHALPSRGRGLAAHGCGVLLPDGGTVLFPGVSGAGKSTLARQIMDDGGDQVLLSDDRLALTVSDGNLQLWGTPWFSQAMAGSPFDGPLRAAVFLHHGSAATIRDIAPGDALRRVMRTLAFPFWNTALMGPALDLVDRLMTSIPVYEFSYRPTPGSATFLFAELQKLLR